MTDFAKFFRNRIYRQYETAVMASRFFSFLGLDALYRWHWVEAGRVARAGQMYGGHVARMLRRHGVKTVVNLRGENPNSGWYPNEIAVCAELGVAHVDVEVSSKRLPSRETLLAILDAVAGGAPPVLIKCDGGADRTGFAVALHLLDRQGAAVLETARGQLSLGRLHGKKAWQRWIAAFFDFFAADRAGREIRAWIAQAYTPERFAKFLEDRGQGDYWRR